MVELIQALTAQGLLGLLLAIALLGLYLRDRELTKAREGRLADAKHIEEVLHAQTEAVTLAAEVSAEQTRVLARLTESVMKSCAMRACAMRDKE